MRPPLIWLWRLLLGGFVVAYFASGTLQLWVPPLLPFLAAVAVEAQFFFSGLRAGGGRAAREDRGPQERDLADFGYAQEVDAEEPGESEFMDPARRVARPRVVRRRLVQLAVVLALLSGLFLLDRSRASWQKLPAHERSATLAVLDREAARIAGHPAKVMCDVSGRHVGYVQDTDGLAEVGGRRMWVTPGICYRLAKVRQMTVATETASGHAIAVFAHEAWHLHGEASEALANCYAYQSGVRVGRALGLSAGTARRLMRQQLADNPTDFAGTAYVVPAGCHRDGAFDLKLDGTHFP
ncbi:MAG TPA: hypothetical protein VLJ44_12825 [Gaiellaceae bacterium]|nr:hypothetical protein [Gaiellaceae bacterium]